MLHHVIETSASHSPQKIADFSFHWTFIFIVLVHFIAIFWMVRSPFKIPSMTKAASSKIQIKTVYTPPPVKSMVTSSPPPCKSTAPSKSAAPAAPVATPTPKVIPKKEVPKEVAKKEVPKAKAPQPNPEPVKKNLLQNSAAKQPEKSEQKAQAAAKEADRAQQEALLVKAKEKLAKLGEAKEAMPLLKSSPLPETLLPQRLDNLQIDTLSDLSVGQFRAQEISYRDEVANRLKQHLRLPEYGMVKVRLTLERSGQVAHLQIISSESSKNQTYIEKTLPSFPFPPLESYFPDTSQYTFLITLNND